MMVDSVMLVVVSDMRITTKYSYKASSFDEQKLRTLFAFAARCVVHPGSNWGPH